VIDSMGAIEAQYSNKHIMRDKNDDGKY